MARLSVSIVCSAHPPGDIRIHSRWVRGLAAAGADVSLIAPRIDPIPEMPPGVEFVPVEPYTRYVDRLRYASRVLKPLSRLSPDIAIYPDPELHTAMLRHRARTACAVVFDRHENFDQPETLYQGSGVSGRLIARVYPRVEGYACRRIDGVIVVLLSMLGALPAGTESIVAHNYPTRAVLDELAAAPDPATSSYTAINLGAVQETRGYRNYLELADLLVNRRGRQDFSLCLGGKWDPGALDWASEFAGSHGLADNLRLIPSRISHAEAVELYRAARIGFSPYIDNPKARNQLQNKVLEFMGAGLPVITSPSSLNRQIIEAAGCGALLWADQLEQLADLIESWMDDPTLAQELGRRGQEYVRANLVWENELERVLPWLAQLAAARSKVSPR